VSRGIRLIIAAKKEMLVKLPEKETQGSNPRKPSPDYQKNLVPLFGFGIGNLFYINHNPRIPKVMAIILAVIIPISLIFWLVLSSDHPEDE